MYPTQDSVTRPSPGSQTTPNEVIASEPYLRLWADCSWLATPSHIIELHGFALAECTQAPLSLSPLDWLGILKNLDHRCLVTNFEGRRMAAQQCLAPPLQTDRVTPFTGLLLPEIVMVHVPVPCCPDALTKFRLPANNSMSSTKDSASSLTFLRSFARFPILLTGVRNLLSVFQISTCRRLNPHDPVNMLKVTVGRNEVGPDRHRVGSYPEHRWWEWDGLSLATPRLFWKAVCGCRPHLHEG